MAGSKLYVGNISYNMTMEQLKEAFAPYGTVTEVNIINGKGFGFVQMSSDEEAEKAKTALNGTVLDGRNIKVDIAKPMQKRERNFGGGGFSRGSDFGGGYGRGGFGRERGPKY